MEDSITIYMDYLLRYVSEYPVTAEQLRKKAAARHFERLAHLFEALPPEQSFRSAGEIQGLIRHGEKPAVKRP